MVLHQKHLQQRMMNVQWGAASVADSASFKDMAKCCCVHSRRCPWCSVQQAGGGEASSWRRRCSYVEETMWAGREA